jgi:Nucleotidyltransferase domain
MGVAVFLVGSYARGDAGPYSDVDLDVLVADGPRNEWPTWFDVEEHQLVCVSVWIRDVATWQASQQEPQGWAFGLPSVETVRLCWVADDSWRARLERSQLAHPPGEPELDHLVGDLGKVANAWRRGDELGLRLAAQDLARSCPSLLQPLNPHPPVGSRHAALLTALDFAVVPPGYHDDLVVCLGLAGRPTSAEEVHAPRVASRRAWSSCWGRTRAGSPGCCPRRWRRPSPMAAYAGTWPNSSGTHPDKTPDRYESMSVGWRSRPTG